MTRTPVLLQTRVAALWNRADKTEEAGLASVQFAEVCGVCRELFCGPSTAYALETEFDFSQLRTEVRNVFRSVGAPWFNGLCPTAEAAATAIQRAYERTDQNVTQLVPLDIA